MFLKLYKHSRMLKRIKKLDAGIAAITHKRKALRNEQANLTGKREALAAEYTQLYRELPLAEEV